MIDQELASIINFVLGAAPVGVIPYYYQMREDFSVPSIFFPPPEFTAEGDTLASYRFEFVWYIPIFAADDADAYSIAHTVANTLMAHRRLVPIIDEAGELTGKCLRMDEPSVKALEQEGVSGMAQLTLRWKSRRPYNAEDAKKMMQFTLNYYK